MEAVLLQVKPSIYTNYSKNSLFFSANAYEKNIVKEKYCVAHHDDKIFFLRKYWNHIIVLKDVKKLLQKMDAFCFNYQHMDFYFTLFK